MVYAIDKGKNADTEAYLKSAFENVTKLAKAVDHENQRNGATGGNAASKIRVLSSRQEIDRELGNGVM